MKENDKITFKYNNTTLIYKVWQTGNKYILVYTGGSISEGKNREIFDLLKIENRFEFCRKVIGYSVADKIASFPEVNSLEDLEKIVNALYERILEISTPKFQVGDLVMVVKREGDEGDYPCSYTNEMLQYENRIFTISEVHKMSISSIKRHILRLKYEETFFYSFEGIDWNWSSGMLHKVEITKIKDITAPDKAILTDIGEVNIGGAPFYINTHSPAFCDSVSDGPSAYQEKSEESDTRYKLTFKSNYLKF